MHGLSKHPIYKTWKRMMWRCYSTSATHFHYYGGRGIRVCQRWMDFRLFLTDMESGYSSGLSIDRIDPNGNYMPSNCRWATQQTQSINKRNVRFIAIHGEKVALVDLARQKGLCPETIVFRLKKGIPQYEAIETPAASNPRPRAVLVDGVIYPSLSAAGRANGVTPQAIFGRMKRKKARYPDV